MKYEMFRLLLEERSVPPLVDLMGEGPRRLSRQDYLLEVFGADFDFWGARGTQFKYKFIGRHNEFVLGRVGKLTAMKYADPNSDLSPAVASLWQAGNFVLDTSNHPDGQKLALQAVPELGKLYPAVKSLIHLINLRNKEELWGMNSRTIIDQSEFWNAVEQYKGKITSLRIELNVPNIYWDSADEVRAALKKAREETGMQSTAITIANKQGQLNPDTPPVRAALNYLEPGGGSVKLRAAGKPVYDSTQETESKNVDSSADLEITHQNEDEWPKLIRMLF